jgi:hypothetical protein
VESKETIALDAETTKALKKKVAAVGKVGAGGHISHRLGSRLLSSNSSWPDVELSQRVGKDGEIKRGVVYLGHLPFGFFEAQLKSFFSQFGEVTRLRVSRSKKVRVVAIARCGR